MAAVYQSLTQPADHVVILGMDQNESAVLAGDRENFENLDIVKPQFVIRHVDLE